MRRIGVLVVGLLVTVTMAGCGWPKDADGTLADVRGGVLRVGVTANPPWVRLDGEPSGAEVELVGRLADRLGATVEWYPGSESSLMAALRDRVLDVVVGGLDTNVPWIEQAALTRPYVTTRTLVAVPEGGAVPEDLAGVRVAVQAGTAEVAALAAEKAEVVTVPEVTGAEGMPVVVGDWRLGELHLTGTGVELAAHEHVWALPPGENGWQVEVERFLAEQGDDAVEELLVAAERAR
ncbi:transporter substrate-binding domain-containing protein [Actinoplanes philippinensis]|uniref:amino acid ABC transporter substrate-binding protein n=1 Tax=Actinoplanes philippinensis TaxID=35752 RepID=UPI0033FBBA85